MPCGRRKEDVDSAAAASRRLSAFGTSFHFSDDRAMLRVQKSCRDWQNRTQADSIVQVTTSRVLSQFRGIASDATAELLETLIVFVT